MPSLALVVVSVLLCGVVVAAPPAGHRSHPLREGAGRAVPVTKLHPTPWMVNGQPLLGSYIGGKDRLEDLRRCAAAGINVVLAGERELDPGTPEGAFCRRHGLKVMHHLTSYVYHGVRLRDPVTAEQTTIPLAFGGGVPDQPARLVQIDDELIRYERMTAEGLVGCRRGADGTTPAAHREGLILFWPEPAAAEIERVKDSPNLYGYYVLDDSPGDAVSALRGLYQAVQRVDPGRRHPVCAGFGDAGSVVNLAPGVCDLMLIYWYPVSASGWYERGRTTLEVQHMVAAARARAPGISFAGVYQAFDGSMQGGTGIPTAVQLRTELEDFVRDGASGLVAFISTAGGMSGWQDLPHVEGVMRQAHREIKETGGLVVSPETGRMHRERIQPPGFYRSPAPRPGVPPAWWTIGPFEDAAGQRLAAVFPPDRGVDLAGVYPVRGGSAGWRVRPTTSGVVGLSQVYTGSGWVAYAACEVTSPREQAAQIRVVSDDDGLVLLNGREVYRFEGSRGLGYDLDVVPVTLPQGRSRLLVKVCNRGGTSGFMLTITDPAGRPLEVEFSPE